MSLLNQLLRYINNKWLLQETDNVQRLCEIIEAFTKTHCYSCVSKQGVVMHYNDNTILKNLHRYLKNEYIVSISVFRLVFIGFTK